MAKINDTDAVIIANAAKRADLKVLPLPRGLKVKGAAANKILDKLVRAGLLASVAATHDDVPWGEAGDGARETLVVTTDGLRAIGIEAEASKKSMSKARAAKNDATRTHTAPTSATARKAGAKPARKVTSAGGATKGATKQEIVLGLLRRSTGASIAELAGATGWQPHSVRGVLTATIKGRLGLSLSSEKGDDGVRRYFVAPNSAGKPS